MYFQKSPYNNIALYTINMLLNLSYFFTIHGEQVFTVAFLRSFKMSYLFVCLFIHSFYFLLLDHSDGKRSDKEGIFLRSCVCACVRVHVRVRVCACVCVWNGMRQWCHILYTMKWRPILHHEIEKLQTEKEGWMHESGSRAMSQNEGSDGPKQERKIQYKQVWGVTELPYLLKLLLRDTCM